MFADVRFGFMFAFSDLFGGLFGFFVALCLWDYVWVGLWVLYLLYWAWWVASCGFLEFGLARGLVFVLVCFGLIVLC